MVEKWSGVWKYILFLLLHLINLRIDSSERSDYHGFIREKYESKHLPQEAKSALENFHILKPIFVSNKPRHNLKQLLT
jgi:hypothetical protein